ncbi:oxidoreductase [Candidatus Saccharibacteria bacterium]|nr:oxidoreductase [Candidatus Saccharibacteria bacterium]
MSNRIDNWLNRVSMYRLVSISLSVMWLSAVVLALAGALDFTPFSLIVSGLVLVGASYLSNRLFGLLFGVRAHDESSYISALILFFIFSPSLELRGLMTLALIGMIASVSKYILTIRGRHIFNPAAIAAVIISLTGLAFASWWVAAPSLLPITLIFALLILHKTRRFTLGLVFLAVAAALVLIIILSYGTPFIEALRLLVLWPFLFFVGFMLSEPLTLPPKKWQQVVEAGLVGVLFALPISIGSFAVTPAVALIVGNVFAFIFSLRRELALTFVSRQNLTPTTDEFVFSLDKELPFKAGQYMEITIPHNRKDGRGLRRSFSLTSVPGESSVKFGVKFYNPSSSFKTAFRKLQTGTIIFGTTVGGDFTLPSDSKKPLLFIAGGIGITPFISHLQYLQKIKEPRDIVLIYIVNSTDEIAYFDIIRNLNVKVFVITKSNKVLSVKNWTLINAPSLTKELLRSTVPDVTTRTAYVSGPPPLVKDAKRHLKRLRVKKIKSDYFTGY